PLVEQRDRPPTSRGIMLVRPGGETRRRVRGEKARDLHRAGACNSHLMEHRPWAVHGKTRLDAASIEGPAMADQVSDHVLERLSQWNIRRVFGYPGDGINGLMGALDRAGDRFEFIRPTHEEVAA